MCEAACACCLGNWGCRVTRASGAQEFKASLDNILKSQSQNNKRQTLRLAPGVSDLRSSGVCLQCWGLNSDPCICQASTLPLSNIPVQKVVLMKKFPRCCCYGEVQFQQLQRLGSLQNLPQAPMGKSPLLFTRNGGPPVGPAPPQDVYLLTVTRAQE